MVSEADPPSQAACRSRPAKAVRARATDPCRGQRRLRGRPYRRGRISSGVLRRLPSRDLLAAGCWRRMRAPSAARSSACRAGPRPLGQAQRHGGPHHPAPATGSAAPAASSGTSLIWLWVLLGVLVLAGLIALIARSARRRSAAAAGWRSKLVDAYAKGSALHDAMSVAEAPGGLAGADAAARWSDIQRRADDLAQTLYALREEVPQHSPDGASIADTLASLQAVRSAMDAERPRAAPAWSRPTWSAAVWPPSSPPSAHSRLLPSKGDGSSHREQWHHGDDRQASIAEDQPGSTHLERV